MLNTFIGLIYGGVGAGSYLFAKYISSNGGLDIACVVSLILFLVHFILWPKLVITAFYDWRSVLRGFLYGVSQIFLLVAQSKMPTSSMLIFSIAGSLAGCWFGRIILRDHLSTNETLAVLVATVGIIIGFIGKADISTWALTGGLIQGITTATARSLMNTNVAKRAVVGSGLLMFGIITFIWLLLTNDLPSVTKIPPMWIVVGVIALAIIQYTFIYVHQIYNTQKATLFSLLRAPWSVIMELILFKTSVSTLTTISSSMIFLSAGLALYRPKQCCKEVNKKC